MLTLLFMMACDQDKQSQIEEVVFNIDFDKMEPTVRDSLLKFGYSLPKGFSEIFVNSDSLDLAAANFSALQIELKHLFKAESGSMMIAFSLLNHNESRIQTILDAPDSLLGQNAYFDNFQAAIFRFNNFEKVYQFIQSNAQIVDFRMIFQNKNGQFIQIDCLSQQSDYKENIKLFESFFGSLYMTS